MVVIFVHFLLNLFFVNEKFGNRFFRSFQILIHGIFLISFDARGDGMMIISVREIDGKILLR